MQMVSMCGQVLVWTISLLVMPIKVTAITFMKQWEKRMVHKIRIFYGIMFMVNI